MKVLFKNLKRFKKSLMLTLLLLVLTGLGSCYLFIDGSMDGFTVDGVYNGGTTTSIGTCSTANLNSWLIYYAGDSSDTQTNSGCLRFSVSGSCFPSTATTGFARFDFVSPHITDWTPAPSGYTFKGFSFSLKTNLPGLYVQGIMKITLTSGATTYYASPFFSVTPYAAWAQFTANIPASAPATFTVEEAYVRVFVPNSTISLYSGPEAVVFLDQVVPVME